MEIPCDKLHAELLPLHSLQYSTVNTATHGHSGRYNIACQGRSLCRRLPL